MGAKSYLLDVVVAEGTAVLQLLAGEDQTLLVRRNALLVLDLALDIVDGVARLHLEGDSLARQGLHEAVKDFAVSFAMSRFAAGVRDRVRSHLHCQNIVSILGSPSDIECDRRTYFWLSS